MINGNGHGNGKDRYWNAVHKLSDLVVRRNEELIELESMATMPLGISPASGFVGRFEVERARRLMDRVDALTALIEDSMAEVRREADAAAMPPVEWMDVPHSRRKMGQQT